MFLEAIQRFCREKPPSWAAPRYAWFAKENGLTGDAGSYAIGAAHGGYGVRRAEESLLVDAEPMPEVSGVLDRLANQSPDADKVFIETQCAFAYATKLLWDDAVLNVLALPGPAKIMRADARDASLSLLVALGATFQRRPSQVSVEHANRAWDFGYMTRCIELTR